MAEMRTLAVFCTRDGCLDEVVIHYPVDRGEADGLIEGELRDEIPAQIQHPVSMGWSVGPTSAPRESELLALCPKHAPPVYHGVGRVSTSY